MDYKRGNRQNKTNQSNYGHNIIFVNMSKPYRELIDEKQHNKPFATQQEARIS